MPSTIHPSSTWIGSPLHSAATIASFQQCLIRWQQQYGRHQLPWQQTITPYRILVSEIMLQQTQVATVIPYFERWMQAFPTIQELANSTEDQVMHLWQGLGYYSRARNLRKAATYIQNDCQGEFPQSLTELIKIPGVGRYTAGAIASFAYNQYGPIVDGNVKRLFCRLFEIDGIPGTTATDKQLWEISIQLTPRSESESTSVFTTVLAASQTAPITSALATTTASVSISALNQQNPAHSHFVTNKINEKPITSIYNENTSTSVNINRTYTQALLDMGATICRAKQPQCQQCPLISNCQAFTQQRVDELPTPKPKKSTPTKSGDFLWIENDGKLLLERRTQDGIWGSLWCLPQYAQGSKVNERFKSLTKVLKQFDEQQIKGAFKHTFTHYKLEATVWNINNQQDRLLKKIMQCDSTLGEDILDDENKSNAGTEENKSYQWYDINELATLGLPTPIRTFIEKNYLKKRQQS